MAVTLQPIRGCPQHSGETGTRLSSAIHRRLLSRFFLREGGSLYTGYFFSCVGAARKVSPDWSQKTMTYHSFNCLALFGIRVRYHWWLLFRAAATRNQFPFVIGSLPLSTIDTTFGNQAFSHDRRKSLVSTYDYYIPP